MNYLSKPITGLFNKTINFFQDVTNFIRHWLSADVLQIPPQTSMRKPLVAIVQRHHESNEQTKNLKSKMTNNNDKLFFAPLLLINNCIKDLSFYAKAFDATENLCFYNDDGSVHVAELSIHGIIFHLHEVTKPYFFSPDKHNCTTCIIGLFVPDVQAFMNNAIEGGAKEISPVKDYEYGYRQGEIEDLFGHHWLIKKKIS